MDEGKGTWEEVLHLAVLLRCIHRMGAEGLGCAAPNPALGWQLPQIYSPKSCQAGSCLKPHPQILPRIGEATASPGKREEGWRPPLPTQEHSEERDSQGQTAPPRRRTKPAGEQEINRKERRGGGRGAGGWRRDEGTEGGSGRAGELWLRGRAVRGRESGRSRHHSAAKAPRPQPRSASPPAVVTQHHGDAPQPLAATSGFPPQGHIKTPSPDGRAGRRRPLRAP